MSTSSPSYSRFVDQVGGLFTLPDENDFVRVWGFLTNSENEIVTFWRHEPKSTFKFMFLASYHFPTTLSAKEAEKIGKGYEPRNPRRRKHTELMRQIHRDYLETIAKDSFHYVPKTREIEV